MIQPNSSRWRARIRCLLRLGAALLLLLALAVARRSYFAFRDRMPGYALDLEVDDKPSRAAPRPLRAGFARVKINPDLANPPTPGISGWLQLEPQSHRHP